VLIDLDPVDRLTAGAVGPAGERVFYLQARKDDRLVTLLVEKQQVQLLAASVVEILSRVGKETGQGPPEEAMELEEPLDPEWRAGRLSIGYQEERDLLVLEAEELLPEDEGDEEEAGEGEPGDPDLHTGVEAELQAELGPELQIELESEVEADLGSEIEAELEAELEAEDEAAATDDLEAVLGSEGPELQPDPGRARFWATREQMLSLARHGAAVCAAGRPRCQLCGNPIDPEGHVCPALNGHREQRES
jgi:uncharacterized repeat protein (TIGR03847 family)